MLRLDLTGSGRTEEINEEANLADSYRLSTPERVPGRRRREQRETKTAGAELGFPSVPVGTSERDKEKQVILVLRFVATSTQDIYHWGQEPLY